MQLARVTDIRRIRMANWPYIFIWILYYAWVIVFTTWWTSSPLTEAVYGAGVRTMLHQINLAASAVFVLLLKKEWFVRVSQIGAAALLVTSILFMTVKHPAAQLCIIVLFGISLGSVNSGILIPFVFVLNNTEKFYAVVSSNLLIAVLLLLQERSVLQIANGFYVSFAMLILALSAIVFFRKESLSLAESDISGPVPKLPRSAVITIILNGLFAIFCKGVGKAFLSIEAAGSAVPLFPIYYIGSLIGYGIYVLIYRFLGKSNHATWNITFGTFVVSMMLHALSGEYASLREAFAFLLGVGSAMGMINMYYILGVIGKKYWSLRYVRYSVLLIGACGGISGVALGRYLTASNSGAFSVALAAVSTLVIVILLAISPLLSFTYYKEDWAADSAKNEIDNRRQFRFDRYNLSPREAELAVLLLDGKTLRQSAAAMGISYPTANTYCNTLYRKLSINSRVELIRLFQRSE